MNIKSLFAASAIALASVSSFAGITFDDGSATIASDPFGSKGTFTQTFTFSGLSAGTYDIVGYIGGRDLWFDSVKLGDVSWEIYNSPDTAKAKTKFGLATLEVTGSPTSKLTVTGHTYGNSASYSGNISFSAVALVPEPETYAMLLAGLGLMGGIARRRATKKQA